MALGITGDIAKTKNGTPAARPFQVVAEADLADATHPVNDQSLSGKEEGAMYMAKSASGVLDLVIAKDATPTGDWVLANAPAGTEEVYTTPA